jgi:hypothetical protein
VDRAVAHGCDELLERAFGDADLELWLSGPHPHEGVRHDRRDRARERPYGQVPALLADQSSELLGGQAQPSRNGIRVGQKKRARGGETQPAGAAVDQANPKLPLEREDLVRDGGLGERQLLRRAGERPLPGYLAKGEQAAWVEH